MAETLTVNSITCDYCGGRAPLTTGATIWPKRPDLAERLAFRCAPCDAHVGCHKGTEIPLGRLANGELRRAKMRAHWAFDPLWKEGELSRHHAYAWLSRAMNLAPSDTHIGMFDVAQCRQVVRLCQKLRRDMAKADPKK